MSRSGAEWVEEIGLVEQRKPCAASDCRGLGLGCWPGLRGAKDRTRKLCLGVKRQGNSTAHSTVQASIYTRPLGALTARAAGRGTDPVRRFDWPGSDVIGPDFTGHRETRRRWAPRSDFHFRGCEGG